MESKTFRIKKVCKEVCKFHSKCATEFISYTMKADKLRIMAVVDSPDSKEKVKQYIERAQMKMGVRFNYAVAVIDHNWKKTKEACVPAMAREVNFFKPSIVLAFGMLANNRISFAGVGVSPDNFHGQVWKDSIFSKFGEPRVSFPIVLTHDVNDEGNEDTIIEDIIRAYYFVKTNREYPARNAPDPVMVAMKKALKVRKQRLKIKAA